MRRFEGRTALVTGAANGIGRACAERLAREGASVVIADVETDAASALAASLPTALAMPCDVTDSRSVEVAVAATLDRFGRLDVLVSNVGVASGVRFADTDDAEWDRQVDPTLAGSMRVIRASLPALLESPGGGAVVATASVNGLQAFGGVAYSAAKAGVINAMKNLAVEYGPLTRGTVGQDGGWVRFNAVAPGTVETRVWTSDAAGRADLEHMAQLHPMGRVGRPEDIAAAVAFLASDDAAWITGVTLPVDGGLTVGPLLHMPGGS
ncbi:NAD(P)-dependent dehydrogenase, short-chain alcohol dehydrogenase family [Paramicrobacterium humi]|uniref:NAD(P)-dependent dehydrogenase, short-chain alcohol dehydrogenase family n=1 Tax=Paramicrobacterium humi TaxID=640635 RepID=A0A1H4KNH7_9MICO|nr:glucose 1-dehydrogenase [Microbacterium humi]SEB59806.1 NAD(P)-dependent dehydrogenase, short-chain alcohol dehydrogenase family [Microbacterium humi]